MPDPIRNPTQPGKTVDRSDYNPSQDPYYHIA